MKPRGFFLPLLFCLGSLCQAQKDATPAGAKPTNAISADLLTVISSAKKVPPACVAEILSNPQNTLSFLSRPLCATYLALSSAQYQAAMKEREGNLTKQLFVDAQATILKAYKQLSQQTGSSTGAAGSTNLASKGAAAQFLALATEYGGLTESTSGATTTVTGTLAGIPLGLLKNADIQACPTNIYRILGANEKCLSPRLVDTLSRISFSVGVDSHTGNQTTSATASAPPSSGTSVPAIFSISSNNLNVTAVTAKWIALQGKPATEAVTTAYKQIISNDDEAQARSLATELDLDEAAATGLEEFRVKIVKQIKLKQNDSTLATQDAQATAVEVWKNAGTEFMTHFGLAAKISPADAASSQVLIDVQKFAIAYAKVIAQEQSIGLAVARPAILTFEYDNNRPLNQPSNSVFRVIYQAKLGQVTLTANGAASIYDSTPSSSIPGSERLRDVQVAAQADRPVSLTLAGKKLDMTGSGSFYFQDQTSPSILNVTPGMPVSGVSFTGLPSTATQVFAQKGNIAIGQAKLTLGSGSNLKVPISVTYSNRTELVTSPVWRGQIGISYDFDSIFTKK